MTRSCSFLLPCSALAIALSLGASSGAMAQHFTDDFSDYAPTSDGWPAWEMSAVGTSFAGGFLVADGGALTWRKPPYAAELTFSCELTVDEETARDQDWATAGIGVRRDERNYWLLNLVRAPKAQDFRHSVELQEMLDGRWLASTLEESRLEHAETKGADYNWQPGTRYELQVSLTDELIRGQVSADGKEVARFAWRFAEGTPAVRDGRPWLRVQGMTARLDNAEVTVMKTTPEPREIRQFPQWISTGRKKLTQGTGFFATHQDAQGRWWLVDPEGSAFFDVGTDHCNYNAHWCQKLGYSPHHRNLEAKYGSADKWAASATDRLKQWNFTTVAAGHHPATRHRGLAHILFASFGSGFAKRDWICEPVHWTGFPNVFSPDWERHCRLVARRIAKDSRGDPWCLGTFYDNELEWYGKRGFLVDELFQRDAHHTGKRAFWGWLLKRYGSVAGINRALGTTYADADAFLQATAVPPPSEALDSVRDEFLAVLGERYFKTCYEALKAADPDHLAMGSRFAGRTPEPVLEAAGKYTDVFTINTYPRLDLERGQLLAVQRQFRDYYAKVQKPFLITEWSFPALDSGLPCQHGAGMRVDTQAQRARCYEIFANAMADLPFMVGYHYFMWVDEPALGISETFPEDSNYGLVNEKDEPYETLVRTAARVNAAAYQRHASSHFSGDLTVRFEGLDLVVHNPTPWPATGKLTALIDGKLQRRDLTVPANGTVKPKDAAWGKATYVLLEEWDGAVTRVAPPRPPGQSGQVQVINAGLTDIAGVPVAAGEERPAVAWVKQLSPGASLALAPVGQLQPTTAVELSGERLTLRSAGAAGHLLDEVVARRNGSALPLGVLDFAAHQVVAGQHQWVTPDRIEERVSARTAEGHVLCELTVARLGDAQTLTAVDDLGRAAQRQTGPARYRARVRLVLFRDQSVLLVQPLWVESLDARPWELVDCFVFCRSTIGGSVENDRKGGPEVPNYYRRAEYWTDAKLGGAFGAISPDESWNVHFWTDPGGGLHPDARREVNQSLHRGERWTTVGGTPLWIYALHDANKVNALVARARQARELLVTGD